MMWKRLSQVGCHHRFGRRWNALNAFMFTSTVEETLSPLEQSHNAFAVCWVQPFPSTLLFVGKGFNEAEDALKIFLD